MSLKKDILATITFLATGLLFLVAQMDGKSEARVSQEADCVVSETLLANEALPPSPTMESVSRDS